uniref:Pe38-like protein n=1 Tax=Anticarsia gemmatalis multiple nucleopolyhedrovirus TaxID=268591 RepID=A0A0S3IW71_9ABAC|nr:pe38 like protein [Anticarsia gemmatalis multiple nucleopolyhedrovirus]ALR70130.1 pe38 like protein [Anticarsia gemmatalis multiple nucleopolyhedrovirus]ALR70287.1 pe38 like protein [Anticarsia gemmatalis multiple nucleopolyhedrovirus]ALR70600.1 pe38 like protein [Anticarsia gemmatalis multiple nucleopolyhedrovirus]ALR72014.1 pe38 like protein [Anticarsia gemmatalis multiple nucleopolyhedrovirus]
MSNRYTPYGSQRNRQQLQKNLLDSFRLKPVTTFGATCSICLETYMMQSNNVTEFLMPFNSTCTHMFCYKCIISMYSNVETTRSNVNCPMCRQNITSWQSFFPNTLVSCKFTKKAAGDVPATLQFMDALKVLQSRCAPTPDDLESANTEARQMLREQLNKLNQENKTLQETLIKNKAQHDIAWESSCTQISALQTRISELEANPEIESLKTALQEIKETNRKLTNRNLELEEINRKFKNEVAAPCASSELQGVDLLAQINLLKTQLFKAKENEHKLVQKAKLDAQLTEAINKNRDLENKNTILVLQSQLMEVESQNRELQDKQQAYELIVQEMKQQLEERGVSVDI